MVARRLPIEYNRKLPVGVVGDDPFSFLIYDKLFDDFLIITDGEKPDLSDLGFDKKTHFIKPDIRSSSDRRFYTTKKFVDLTKQQPKRKFITYAPVDPPYKINPLNLLMNSPAIAHAYENKRYFRDEFADLIRMPEYVIKYVSELDKATSYHELREEFDIFVLQDEESAGSKGTHIIRSHDDYVEAVKSLKKNSSGRSVVVSKYIKGDDYSTQVCITKYGVFSGGVQKQLIDSKYLCNPKLQGASKWCGGIVGAEYKDIVQHQAHEMATIVGSELASHGYKGIFGIDLIITPENEVYAVEINARQTGYSFLISDMQLKEGKIPFMLLHALELGNFDYEVQDLNALPSISHYSKPISYMIINNPLEEGYEMKHHIRPGIYSLQRGRLVFEKSTYSISQLRDDNKVFIISKYNQGDTIDSGKRILKVFKTGESMSGSDLNAKSRKLIEVIKKQFKLPNPI